MEFSSQEYWNGWPFPSPGDLPDPGNPGIESASPALQASSLPLSHQEAPTACLIIVIIPGQNFFLLCLCPFYKVKKICSINLSLPPVPISYRLPLRICSSPKQSTVFKKMFSSSIEHP